MYKLEEKKIIFDDEKMFAYLPHIGFGSQGDVYKFRIGSEIYALKLFNGLEKVVLKDYEQKLNINIDTYISPKKLLYVGPEFRGYIMKFCGGTDFSRKNSLNISIDQFAQSGLKLFEDTKKLTDLKFVIYDTYISNVMYDGGFKMIDIDRYTYEKNLSKDEINKKNNERINLMLIDIFKMSTNLDLLVNSSLEFGKIIRKCQDGYMTFEELFNMLCLKSYKEVNQKIGMDNEDEKVLKKVKK